MPIKRKFVIDKMMDWKRYKDLILERLNNFEFRITLSILIAVIIVAIIGFTAYFSLSNIVKNVSKSVHKDEKLLLINEILSDISNAESHAKSFTFTNDDKYLLLYNNSERAVSKRIKKLIKLSAGDSSAPAVDSLVILTHKKFSILDNFISLRDTGRMGEVLGELSQKINPTSPSEVDEGESDRARILSRIFKRNKRNRESGNSSPQIRDFKSIKQEIDRLLYLEEENAIEIASAQMKLTEEDRLIMEKIRGIFGRLEAREKAFLAENTKKAEALAARTNGYIAAFSIGLTGLLFALGYFIIQNINKSRSYNEQLKQAKKATEELAEAKELFVANMSHEIRTPLHAIAGFSEQLISEDLQPKQKEQLEIIKKSGDHLLKLVNNILDLTKINSGKLQTQTETFELGELAADLLKVVTSIADEKGIKLVKTLQQEEIWLDGDVVKIRQILINLLTNAVKYTEKGFVEFKADIAPKDRKTVWLVISITDTGIGIAKDQQNLLFDEFAQVKSKHRLNYGGTGLGLAISKKLVNYLGGNIQLESELNKGTKVKLQLPVRRSSGSFVLKTHINPGNPLLQGYNFLLADDEPFNLKLLCVLLKKYKAGFTETTNGHSLLEAFEQGNYDAVLLDLTMPEMSGYEVAEKIRMHSDKSKRNVPILALTAAVEPEVVQKCKSVGIEHVITKPFLENELITLLQNILEPESKKTGKQTAKKFKSGNNNHQDSHEPKIKITGLMAMSNGDGAFIKDMLFTFVTSSKNHINKMYGYLANEDYEGLSEAAHSMLPPCRHLGLFSAIEILKDIESYSSNSGNLAQLRAKIESLDQLIQDIELEVNGLIKNLQL